MTTKQKIWELMNDVYDPEVPVLTVVDLGIIRDVIIEDSDFIITITPTYSGCPAMQRIEDDIKEILAKNNIENFRIKLVFSPAWTTDWMSESGRKKLKEYGIAPPENESDKSTLFAKKTIIPCPLCNSKSTKLISEFGSTSCKSLYKCNDCLEPFDYFKCLK